MLGSMKGWRRIGLFKKSEVKGESKGEPEHLQQKTK